MFRSLTDSKFSSSEGNPKATSTSPFFNFGNKNTTQEKRERVDFNNQTRSSGSSLITTLPRFMSRNREEQPQYNSPSLPQNNKFLDITKFKFVSDNNKQEKNSPHISNNLNSPFNSNTKILNSPPSTLDITPTTTSSQSVLKCSFCYDPFLWTFLFCYFSVRNSLLFSMYQMLE
jgi:hypothetical protein